MTHYKLLYIADLASEDQFFGFPSRGVAFQWQEDLAALKRSIAGINLAHGNIKDMDLSKVARYNDVWMVALGEWLRKYNDFFSTYNTVPPEVVRVNEEIIGGLTAAEYYALPHTETLTFMDEKLRRGEIEKM
jgi:hypothetical protein